MGNKRKIVKQIHRKKQIQNTTGAVVGFKINTLTFFRSFVSGQPYMAGGLLRTAHVTIMY